MLYGEIKDYIDYSKEYSMQDFIMESTVNDVFIVVDPITLNQEDKLKNVFWRDCGGGYIADFPEPNYNYDDVKARVKFLKKHRVMPHVVLAAELRKEGNKLYKLKSIPSNLTEEIVLKSRAKSLEYQITGVKGTIKRTTKELKTLVKRKTSIEKRLAKINKKN